MAAYTSLFYTVFSFAAFAFIIMMIMTIRGIKLSIFFILFNFDLIFNIIKGKIFFLFKFSNFLEFSKSAVLTEPDITIYFPNPELPYFIKLHST